MKKSEFKKLIKPIVSECIKESLLEDGMISGIIAEVVKGMSQQTIVETKAPQPKVDPTMERIRRNAFDSEQTNKLQEHKKKLMSAIGGSAYNNVDLFEGTLPAAPEASPSQQATALAGTDPGDPGVDISGLFGSVSNHWNAHMNEMKERK